MDFKCVVRNTLSFQMLHATVKEGMCLGDFEGKKHVECSVDAGQGYQIS